MAREARACGLEPLGGTALDATGLAAIGAPPDTFRGEMVDAGNHAGASMPRARVADYLFSAARYLGCRPKIEWSRRCTASPLPELAN